MYSDWYHGSIAFVNLQIILSIAVFAANTDCFITSVHIAKIQNSPRDFPIDREYALAVADCQEALRLNPNDEYAQELMEFALKRA